MYALYTFFTFVFSTLIFLLFTYIILSWLVALNVVNTHNRFVNMVGQGLHQFFEPMLTPIRRVLPAFSGLDLSPLVLLIAIYVLRALILQDILPALFG